MPALDPGIGCFWSGKGGFGLFFMIGSCAARRDIAAEVNASEGGQVSRGALAYGGLDHGVRNWARGRIGPSCGGGGLRHLKSRGGAGRGRVRATDGDRAIERDGKAGPPDKRTDAPRAATPLAP